MTEVLTSLFAPIFIMLVLLMIGERIIYALIATVSFVRGLLTGPVEEVRYRAK